MWCTAHTHSKKHLWNPTPNTPEALGALNYPEDDPWEARACSLKGSRPRARTDTRTHREFFSRFFYLKNTHVDFHIYIMCTNFRGCPSQFSIWTQLQLHPPAMTGSGFVCVALSLCRFELFFCAKNGFCSFRGKFARKFAFELWILKLENNSCVCSGDDNGIFFGYRIRNGCSSVGYLT